MEHNFSQKQFENLTLYSVREKETTFILDHSEELEQSQDFILCSGNLQIFCSSVWTFWKQEVCQYGNELFWSQLNLQLFHCLV